MTKHCKGNSVEICKCQTCGLVQDGEAKPCSIPAYCDDDGRISWGSLYDKVLCVLLFLVAVYGIGKAAGKW